MGRQSLAASSLSLGLLLALTVGGEDHARDKGKGDDVKAKAAKGAIVPDIDRCAIDVEGRMHKPVNTFSPGPGEHVAGGLRLRLEGGTVRAFGMGGETSRWTAKAPGGVELAWLAADEKAIYLAGYTVDKKTEESSPELPLRVRRLGLASGKWLEDLDVGAKPRPKGGEGIESVLVGSGRVVALTVAADEDKGWDGAGQQVSYRVTSFTGGKTRPAWSKTVRSAGKVARPGAVLLWAAAAPQKVQPDIRQLGWIGEDVLVCAGPVQDLLCLDGGTGKERWRVERVWEYERGFIGPSVWQHLFYRPGTEAVGKKAGKQGGKERGPSGRLHSIVGGPVVVDVPKNRRGERVQRIFVAVAKGPAEYGEYLADCVVYELGSDGKPLAMATLPRMIRGGDFQIQTDGVVWACHGGAFVKVGLSRDRGVGHRMGPGGPDLLCRIDWYRHISPEEPDAWLTAGPAGDPVPFGDGFALRVCAGGYVTDPDAGVYCFPLSMIDTKTGVDRAMVLRVPYKGKLPEPKTNFSREQSPKGRMHWRTSGPHVLAVTGLQVEGKRLRVTLGMEEWASSLEFAIDDIQGRKRK